MLRPIRLDELKRAPKATKTLSFSQFFNGFDSLIPVEGQVALTHQKTFLDVSGIANTIVTLTCHRCLQQFNHRLTIQFQELLVIEALPTDIPPELELDPEDLAERITPNGVFDVEDWVYQNLYLHLPNQLPCQEDCPGMGIQGDAKPIHDPRWSTLLTLRNQLDSN